MLLFCEESNGVFYTILHQFVFSRQPQPSETKQGPQTELREGTTTPNGFIQ